MNSVDRIDLFLPRRARRAQSVMGDLICYELWEWGWFRFSRRLHRLHRVGWAIVYRGIDVKINCFFTIWDAKDNIAGELNEMRNERLVGRGRCK